MKPLYLQIADYITNLIELQNLEEGTELPTQAELAQKFNTTRMTVSQAYRHLSYNGAITRIRGKGTYVSKSGRREKSRAGITEAWGLVIPRVTSYATSSIAHGIMDVADTKGYLIILCSYNYDPEREMAHIQRLVSIGVDGLIIRPGVYEKPPLSVYQMVSDRGIPMVFLNEAPVDAPLIATDHHRAGYMCANHLLGIGRKRLLYCGFEKVLACSLDIRGVEHACRELESRFSRDDVILRGRMYSAPEIREPLREYLRTHGAPDGIICYNDLVASEVYKEVTDHGLHVPDQVALICCEDGPYAVNNPGCPISGAVFPKYDQGFTAGMMLFDLIEEGVITGSKTILMEPKLALRESGGGVEHQYRSGRLTAGAPKW